MALNIVDLIENNPLTRLTQTYQGRLLTKIKEKFTANEQQMFVASFYCYLNYNPASDYVVDLDDVWKWLGFSTKQKAKFLLEKNFVIENDYKCLLNPQVKQSDHTRGGHNKETIMLTIRTFKLFCLKAGTKKAEQIHDYYIKLEETLQEIIQEESNELKLQLAQKSTQLAQKSTQLAQKSTQLEEQILLSAKENAQIRERTLLEQFPPNTQCFYYGVIGNLSDKNERLLKFGNSNFLNNRVRAHKKTYLNFRLMNVFKVENKIQIENALKEHPLFKERQRTLTIHYKKYIEILNLEGLEWSVFDQTIKAIISQLEYSPENYLKILEANRVLKTQLECANQTNNTEKVFILENENARLKLENEKLLKRYTSVCRQARSPAIESALSPPDPNHILNSLKKHMKNKDGVYMIEGTSYKILEGTRQEVWDGQAYKTSGGLLKAHFILNKNGNIVSKRKSLSESNHNRFAPLPTL